MPRKRLRSAGNSEGIPQAWFPFAAACLCVARLVEAAPPVQGAPLGTANRAVPVRPAAPAPSLAVVVEPRAVVADNVRAASALYAAACLDEMKLFAVADRIADDFQKGTLPIGAKDARDRLAAYHAARNERPTPAERAELLRFVSELVQMEFEEVVTDSLEQMRSYANLVAEVAASVDAFTDDNVSPDDRRDRLAEDTRRAAAALALSMSNRGYGAARVAASRLAAQARDARAIVADRAVLDAYRARSDRELVARLGGKSPAEIERLERRAEAGSRLVAALADHAALLDVPAKRRELARRLAARGADARAWLAARPERLPRAATKLRPLCFDAKRRVVPCRVEKRR